MCFSRWIGLFRCLQVFVCYARPGVYGSISRTQRLQDAGSILNASKRGCAMLCTGEPLRFEISWESSFKPICYGSELSGRYIRRSLPRYDRYYWKRVRLGPLYNRHQKPTLKCLQKTYRLINFSSILCCRVTHILESCNMIILFRINGCLLIILAVLNSK